jgi:hypothetical protein
MMCRFESCSGHKTHLRPDGEIGRHASLRGWCSQGCASSSLVLGTKTKPDCKLQSGFIFNKIFGLVKRLEPSALLSYRIINRLQNLFPDFQIRKQIIIPGRINPVGQENINNFIIGIYPDKCPCVP